MKAVFAVALVVVLAGCGTKKVTSGPPAEGSYSHFRQTCSDTEESCKKAWRNKLADEIIAKQTARAQANKELEQEASKRGAAQREAKGAAEEARFEAALAERTKLLAGKKKDPYNSCFEQWKVNGEYREMPCDPNNKTSYEMEYERDKAERKAKCGKDFEQLRIGMTLDRFEKCTDGVVFVTDSMTATGVVETYRSTFYYLLVKNGRVVSYTRRTR